MPQMRAVWWMTLLFTGTLLSGCISADPEPVEATEPTYTSLDEAIGEGLVDVSKIGPRAGKLVEWPQMMRDREFAEGEERPGDMKEDDLVAQRRITNTTYWQQPLDPTVPDFVNVHGTPSSPYCICDLEFVLQNETDDVNGHDNLVMYVRDSSWVLIDNVSFFGKGALFVYDSHNVTIRNFLSYNSGGFEFLGTRDIIFTESMIVGDGALLTTYNTPPVLYECWPKREDCRSGGYDVIESTNVELSYNYFLEAGGGNFFSSVHGAVLYTHNTAFDGGSPLVSGDDVEMSWNLLRGAYRAGFAVAGINGHVHNNSIAFTGMLDHGELPLQQPPALQMADCLDCLFEHNDILGYVIPGRSNGPEYMALLRIGHATFRNDYWSGTVGPLVVGDPWIRNPFGLATYEVESVALEPNHPIEQAPYGIWLEHTQDSVGVLVEAGPPLS